MGRSSSAHSQKPAWKKPGRWIIIAIVLVLFGWMLSNRVQNISQKGMDPSLQQPSEQEAQLEQQAEAHEEEEEPGPEAIAMEELEPLPPPSSGAKHAGLHQEGNRFYFRATIKGSLYQTLVDNLPRARSSARLAYSLSTLTTRVMMWKMDLTREARPGDFVRIIFSKNESRGGIQIDALEYTSRLKEAAWRMYLHKPRGDEFAHYFDRSGREVEPRLKNSPLKDYQQITETLTSRRGNKGVVFQAPEGTPVFSPFQAMVRRVNWNTRVNGQCVELLFVDSQVHAYFMHLKQLAPTVRPGQLLDAGAVIGEVGRTGRAANPRLHYQLEKPAGNVLNPFDCELHTTYHRKLNNSQKSQFFGVWSRMDRHLNRLR